MASTRPLGRAFGAFALAAFLIAPAVVQAQDSDALIARVNGVEIHQSDLALAEDEVGASMPQMAPDQKREYLITYLTDVVILAQAADKQKIGDRDDVKRHLAFERNKVLMETLLQDTGKAALTDDAMHKVYDDAVKQMPPEEEVHARHILVPTEAEAKDIEDQLKKGADFATLAKEKSKDPGAADGGDLGYFTKEQMVPEFSEAAFKLEKGRSPIPSIRSSAGTSSRSRISAPSRRRPSTRSAASSRISSLTRRKPKWSRICANPRPSSASTSRRRRRQTPQRSIRPRRRRSDQSLIGHARACPGHPRL